MLIAAKNKSYISELKELLSKEFEMKDLRYAKKILGMEIYRDRKVSKLWLTQKNYVKKDLKRFSMFNAKPVQTLPTVHFWLSSEKCPSI